MHSELIFILGFTVFILLMLALATTSDVATIRRMFNEY